MIYIFDYFLIIYTDTEGYLFLEKYVKDNIKIIIHTIDITL